MLLSLTNSLRFGEHCAKNQGQKPKYIFSIFSYTDSSLYHIWCIRSDQISRSVVFNSLRPHELQYARPPWLSPTPGVHSDSRPSSQWCHPAISSSVIPFSSCPQSLPASESFPMSPLITWGGQSTGVSASATVLSMKLLWNIEGFCLPIKIGISCYLFDLGAITFQEHF